ncbi:hypothetical protein ABH923_000872 [Leifsonia sp. EB41]|jgi:hypothetical protein|uniref:hypothetical protein n=1 Tax=Leifsonia sp. EB41 TaxID=3156260 RepID=UPI003510FF89
MALLAASLTGCYGGPGPHEYDLVDAATKQLGVTAAGVVLTERHYGQMKRMSGPGPTVEFRIATEDPLASRIIVENAIRNGWDGSLGGGPIVTGWASTSTGGYQLELAISPWTSNWPVPGAEDKTQTSNRSGIDVVISQS